MFCELMDMEPLFSCSPFSVTFFFNIEHFLKEKNKEDGLKKKSRKFCSGNRFPFADVCLLFDQETKLVC